jgi:hypothetical protein
MPSLKLHCAVSRERIEFDFDNSADISIIREFWDKQKGDGGG